jgi:hypothetical protein
MQQKSCAHGTGNGDRWVCQPRGGHVKSLHVHSYPPRVISGPKIPISITHPWSRCVGTRIAPSTTHRTGEQGPFGTAVISPPVSFSPPVRQHFGPGVRQTLYVTHRVPSANSKARTSQHQTRAREGGIGECRYHQRIINVPSSSSSI